MHFFNGDLARQHLVVDLAPAFFVILLNGFVVGHGWMEILVFNRDLHLFDVRVVDMVVPQLQHRRGIAAAHARRAKDANLAGRVLFPKIGQ